MKRKSLLLGALLLPVLALVSCGKKSPSSERPSSTQDVWSAEPTDSYLVQDGATDYKLLLPSAMSSELYLARNEMTRFFQEATGISLSLASGDAEAFDASKKFISIGKSNYYQTAGFAEEEQSSWKRDAARVVSKGNSIFLYGKEDIGSLYAVYDFLSEAFHFEAYASDTYEIDTGVKDLRFYRYDILDEPDIDYRQRRGLLFPTTSSSDDTMYAYRMRALDTYGDKFLKIHLTDSPSSGWMLPHNSFYFFPKNQYQAEHPLFYSNDGNQLCYTAHGDENELTAMVNFAAAKVESSLKMSPTASNPQISAVMLGMNDTPYLCDCAACKAVKEAHYGSDAAAIIIFLNRVGALVNEWMAKPENAAYARPLDYVFLAYQSAITPPFSRNEDGTFSYAEDILPSEGVKINPFVAFMGFDYGKGFYDPANEEMRERLEEWGAFYPGAWAWSYGGFFNDYLSFYDMFSFYQDYHADLAKNGYQFSFEQIHDDQRGAETGFNAAATYASLKKAWDSSLDIGELMERYFSAAYGPAKEAMWGMFQSLRLWFAEQSIKEGWGSSSIQLSVTGNPKYWSKGYLDELFGDLEEAYGEISVYQKDASLYEKYRRHIDAEWLFPAKVAISALPDSYDEEELAAIKKKFKAICQEQGVKDIREFVSIQSFLDSLE